VNLGIKCIGAATIDIACNVTENWVVPVHQSAPGTNVENSTRPSRHPARGVAARAVFHIAALRKILNKIICLCMCMLVLSAVPLAIQKFALAACTALH
jgi:hypothetical protein